MLDAPCSGLGTLRRDPDLKWTRTAEDLPRLVADEDRMIARAAEAVCPGGRMVYATCRVSPRRTARSSIGFSRLTRNFRAGRPTAHCAAASPLLNDVGDMASLPFRDSLDAFFAAVLVRRKTA
jgi:16S rRNA (cytosine967-C5)-methyltransferase